MTDTRYISAKETTQQVRLALKAQFPSVKFSVRLKGSSVRVEWVDGPTVAMVEEITHRFEGARFDAMQDLQESVSWTDEQGNTVHYLVNYVIESRDYSREFLEKVAERCAYYYGLTAPKINDNGVFDYNPQAVPVESHSWDTLTDKIGEWCVRAVAENDKIVFVGTPRRPLEQRFEFLNEHPDIRLSENCYHPLRKQSQ